MRNVFDVYRAVHSQGFVPIFVEDQFDSHRLLEGCLLAGFKCVEYTLRRRDAHLMIPWIRKNYPDVILLAGSTLDNERIVAHVRRQHPQMLTIAQLADLGVDGFVSMIGWSEQSIRRYSAVHLVIPTAMTVNEAFEQVGYGAHFIKLLGPDVSFVKRCRADAAFGYCPIMVTGGMTCQQIPAAIEAGAVLVGAGFDLTLKGHTKDVDPKTIASVLKEYQAVVKKARTACYPQLAANSDSNKELWLDSLPHYHPF
jgi:2-keto-3-deoxy-6-phosphogluconate aldolase